MNRKPINKEKGTLRETNREIEATSENWKANVFIQLNAASSTPTSAILMDWCFKRGCLFCLKT